MARPSLRGVASIGYAVAYALIAVAYLVAPPARTARPGVISIARYIDTLGPIWTAAFGIAAAALVVTVIYGRLQYVAHSLGAAVIAGYGVASLLSGFLSEAYYGSPLAFLCFATLVQHLILGRQYQTVPQGARHAQ